MADENISREKYYPARIGNTAAVEVIFGRKKKGKRRQKRKELNFCKTNHL